jgi:hypothetical protein
MREDKADARAWRGARQGRLPDDIIKEEVPRKGKREEKRWKDDAKKLPQ